MDASEIGMEELLPQKRRRKNNFNCIGTIEKTYCISTSEKNMGRTKYWN